MISATIKDASLSFNDEFNSITVSDISVSRGHLFIPRPKLQQRCTLGPKPLEPHVSPTPKLKTYIQRNKMRMAKTELFLQLVFDQPLEDEFEIPQKPKHPSIWYTEGEEDRFDFYDPCKRSMSGSQSSIFSDFYPSPPSFFRATKNWWKPR